MRGEEGVQSVRRQEPVRGEEGQSVRRQEPVRGEEPVRRKESLRG